MWQSSAFPKTQVLLFSNTRVDQIVGKSPKSDGETAEDQSMMGRLVKVEKQVKRFLPVKVKSLFALDNSNSKEVGKLFKKSITAVSYEQMN